MKKLIGAVLFSLVLLASFTASANSLPPLRVSDAFGEVTAGACVKLPVITWGGEYAMTYANGNAAHTANGSLFNKAGWCFDLALQDDPKKQLSDYVTGKTPFLRGTTGMINAAAEFLSSDLRLQPVTIVLLTRSTGGDALVVGPGINTLADLKGKRIAMQGYGPHMDFGSATLTVGGFTIKDVTIVWTKDLVGVNGDTPAAALLNKKADAAFVITPDALTLTTVSANGTCAEGCSKGAKILFTTVSASYVIFDVYAVRADYFNAHKAELFEFAKAIMKSQEELNALNKAKGPAWKAAVTGFWKVINLPDYATAEVMFADCTPALLAFNEKFFTDVNYARNFNNVCAEVQDMFIGLGMMKARVPMTHAGWDYAVMKSGGKLTYQAEAPKYDEAKVASVVSEMDRSGTLNERQLLKPIEVTFAPNDTSFDITPFKPYFDDMLKKMATLGGAIMVTEGHADPLGYLKAKKAGKTETELRQIRQSAKNTSLSRANAVRDAFIQYARSKGVTIDPSQFTVVGSGFEKPKSGMCGVDPCAPKTEADWKANMRVEFKVIQVEAEASSFEAL